MKTIAKNWKTTTAGVLMLGMTVAVKMGWITADVAAAITTILGAVGLIVSKDGNVTGGTTPQ